MAMTAKVKDELSRLEVTKPCCRKAEVAATLRFAGGLHIVGGQIVVEAELDTANAARRLRRFVAEVYGHKSDVLVMSASGLARPPGPRPAAQGRQRLGVRLRGSLARCLPCPRLAHRAGALVRAGGDLSWTRGGARPRRRGAADGHPGQGP